MGVVLHFARRRKGQRVWELLRYLARYLAHKRQTEIRRSFRTPKFGEFWPRWGGPRRKVNRNRSFEFHFVEAISTSISISTSIGFREGTSLIRNGFNRGTSLIRKRLPLGPYGRPMPRILAGARFGPDVVGPAEKFWPR